MTPIFSKEFFHRGERAYSPEPLAASSDLMSGQGKEPIMSHWHDTMVDRPEADGAVYVTGLTISGLAVLAVILAVWVFAI
jgi:hypothetical protein